MARIGPISGQLQASVNDTTSAAKKAVLVHDTREFEATLGPVGDPTNADRAARRMMRTWKDY